MKPKNFAALIIIVAIVGTVLWWLFQKTNASPEKAKVSVMGKTTVPNTTAQNNLIEKPKLPAVISKSAETAPVPSDPQADLKTAISDIVRLYHANDMATLAERYTQPDDYNAEETKQELQDEANSAAESAEMQSFLKQLHDNKTQSWEELESETPTLNAAGDEASYVFISRYPNLAPTVIHQHFTKINGKWYIAWISN